MPHGVSLKCRDRRFPVGHFALVPLKEAITEECIVVECRHIKQICCEVDRERTGVEHRRRPQQWQHQVKTGGHAPMARRLAEVLVMRGKAAF